MLFVGGKLEVLAGWFLVNTCVDITSMLELPLNGAYLDESWYG